ncbi:uncharacterized protein C8Q71DRAFT_733865 [Rhodofomes roseus]|uniref:Uncharacterized protein n=1 Tax=Rhodofomes roseus TaxID=34475 RepID=A0ABQ8KUL5_9APHY|nr:uncharacterized protein C8Q71DRAFT_733865 [Rhodofomes roseus]KAH9842669.1 hypothetical protein C8Q71DRAFT_733865 [Rhodofomes roseus]
MDMDEMLIDDDALEGAPSIASDGETVAEMHEVDEQLNVPIVSDEYIPADQCSAESSLSESTRQHSHIREESGRNLCSTSATEATPVNDSEDVDMCRSKDAPDLESSDDDEGPSISQPSTDIRADLETILVDDLAETFKGSYSMNRTYTDVPNPGLTLLADDIGVVGLPLSEREAKVVKSACHPVMMQTLGDTTHSAWAMNANQVLFANPAWEGFTQRVVGDVCSALGVDVAESQPRCELSHLLLHEEGANSDVSSKVFASIHVVLPSKFTGGATQISHGSRRIVYDECAESALKTIVRSWHADAVHELQPITSGYRLALSYNILHAPSVPRPTLSDDSIAIAELRRILLSWKRSIRADTPRKIIYLLDHHYPDDSLKVDTLKGPDAHKVSVLYGLAQQCGICLGLATFEAFQTTPVEDLGYYHTDDTCDESVTITNLTDFNGQLLQRDVEFAYKDMIPNDTHYMVQEGSVFDEEHRIKSMEDDVPDMLKRSCRRTALIIRPQHFDLDKTYEDDISSMLDELVELQPGKSRKRDRRLVEFLFNLSQAHAKQKGRVARTLCSVACSWQDFQLWKRTAKLCEATLGVKTLGSDVVFRSIETFGFQLLLPIMEEMVHTEEDNEPLFQFLDALEKWAGDFAGARQGVLEWARTQREFAINHLAKPRADDGRALLQTTLEHGGLPALQDSIVPQLCRISDPSFLLSLADLLKLEALKPDVSLDAQRRITKMHMDVLSAAIRRVDLYKTTTSAMVKLNRYPWQRSEPVPEPAIAMTYMDACLAADSDELVGQLVKKLTNLPTGRLSEKDTTIRMNHVLIPLLPLVGVKLRARPANSPTLPSVAKLYEETVLLFLRTRPTALTKEDLSWLVQTAILHGGIDFLEKTVWPVIRSSVAYTDNDMSEFVNLLRAHAGDFPPSRTGSSVRSLASKVVRHIVEKAKFYAYARPRYMTGARTGSEPDITKAIELLSLCHRTDCMDSCTLLFKRLLAPPSLSPEYVEHILVPLLPELRKFLLENGLSLSDEPFSAVFKTVLMLWGKRVLGPKPNDVPADVMAMLASYRCKCVDCTTAFNFLMSSPERDRAIHRLGAARKKHLESMLVTYARRAATWSVLRAVPQGLLITKDDTIHRPIQWKLAKSQSATILASISPDYEELKRILGADYQVIIDMMDGRMPEAGALPTASPDRSAAVQKLHEFMRQRNISSQSPPAASTSSVSSERPAIAAPSTPSGRTSLAQPAASSRPTGTSVAPPPPPASKRSTQTHQQPTGGQWNVDPLPELLPVGTSKRTTKTLPKTPTGVPSIDLLRASTASQPATLRTSPRRRTKQTARKGTGTGGRLPSVMSAMVNARPAVPATASRTRSGAPAMQPVASSQSSKTATPSRKRKRVSYDPLDVIDLTSD